MTVSANFLAVVSHKKEDEEDYEDSAVKSAAVSASASAAVVASAVVSAVSAEKEKDYYPYDPAAVVVAAMVIEDISEHF